MIHSDLSGTRKVSGSVADRPLAIRCDPQSVRHATGSIGASRIDLQLHWEPQRRSSDEKHRGTITGTIGQASLAVIWVYAGGRRVGIAGTLGDEPIALSLQRPVMFRSGEVRGAADKGRVRLRSTGRGRCQGLFEGKWTTNDLVGVALMGLLLPWCSRAGDTASF